MLQRYNYSLLWFISARRWLILRLIAITMPRHRGCHCPGILASMGGSSRRHIFGIPRRLRGLLPVRLTIWLLVPSVRVVSRPLKTTVWRQCWVCSIHLPLRFHLISNWQCNANRGSYGKDCAMVVVARPTQRLQYHVKKTAATEEEKNRKKNRKKKK